MRRLLFGMAVLLASCDGDECNGDSDCGDSSRCVHARLERRGSCTDRSDCSDGDYCANVRRDSDGDKISGSGMCVHSIGVCVTRETVASARPGDDVGGGWRLDAITVGTGGVNATVRRSP